MAKKQTELSVLVDIRDFLRARFPHEPVLKPESGLIIPEGGFLGLMRSPDRFENLSDGWFRDRFLTACYGKKYDWSPEALEKYLVWQAAQDHAMSFCDQTFNSRQPDDFELSTLIDRSKREPAIIDAAKILGLKTKDWYWSNRPVAGYSSFAWCVGFSSGLVFNCGKDGEFYVRPVRLSQ